MSQFEVDPEMESLVASVAQANGLDPALLHKVIQTESGYNPAAVSPKGAAGLMQLMPATAGDLGLSEQDRMDPVKNVNAGAKYLAQMIKGQGGDVTKGLAAYNWGPGNMQKKGFDAIPEETQNYIAKITGSMPTLSQQKSAQFPTETKKAQLADVSQAKKQYLDPNAEATAQFLNKMSASTQALKSGQDTSISGQLDTLNSQIDSLTQKHAVYDPDSKQNEGKVFTGGELQEAGGLSWKHRINELMGIKKGAGDVAGNIAQVGVGTEINNLAKLVSPDAIPAYKKYQENQKIDANLKDIRAQRDAGTLSADAALKQELTLRNQLQSNALTADEQKLLDAHPDTDQLFDTSQGKMVQYTHRNSNRELLDQMNKLEGYSTKAPKAIDNLLGGSKHFNDYRSGLVQTDIAAKAKEYSEDTDEAAQLIKNGDTMAGLAKGIPAYSKLILDSIAIASDDPTAVVQMISEEMPDLLLAKFGRLGLATSAVESLGRASKAQTEGIMKYIRENNALPDDAQLAKIGASSLAMGGLDMVSDLTLSGAGSAMAKGLKHVAAGSIAAEVKSAKVFIKETAKGLGKLGVDGGVEGVTEGAESLLDDYTTELRPIGSTEKAMTNAAMGTLVGLGMHPTAAAAEASLKVASVGAKVAAVTAAGVGLGATAVGKGIQNSLTPKSEARVNAESITKGTADKDYKTNLDEAVKTGDVSKFADPASADFKPLLAINALAAMNASPDITPEAKVANENKAAEIYSDLDDYAITHSQRTVELRDKASRTGKEEREYQDLLAVEKQVMDTLKQANASFTAMHPTTATPEEVQTELAEVAENKTASIDDIDSVLRKVFAGNGGADMTSFGSSLAALAANPNTSPETKDLVSKVQAFQSTREKLEEAALKSTDEVHGDIMQGGNGFKGINNYTKSIPTLLQAGKENEAKAELAALDNFAQGQEVKARTLRRATEAAANKTELAPEDQANLAALNAKRKTPFVPNPVSAKWGATLDSMQVEAQALREAADIARGLFPLYAKKAPAAQTTTPAEPVVVDPIVAKMRKAFDLPATPPPTAKTGPEAPTEPVKPVPTKPAGPVDNSWVGTHTRALASMTTVEDTAAYLVKQTKRITDSPTLKPANKAGLIKRMTLLVNDRNAAITGKKVESVTPAEKRQSTTQPVADTVAPSSEEVPGKIELKAKLVDELVAEGYPREVATAMELMEGNNGPRLFHTSESYKASFRYTGKQTFTPNGYKEPVEAFVYKHVLSGDIVYVIRELTDVIRRSAGRYSAEEKNAYKAFLPDGKSLDIKALKMADIYSAIGAEFSIEAILADRKESTEPVVSQPIETKSVETHEAPVDETQAEPVKTTIPLNAELTAAEPGVEFNPKDYRGMNLVRALMSAKSVGINLLQTMPNVFTTLKDMVAARSLQDLKDVFNDKHPLDQAAANLLNDMSKFGVEFSTTLGDKVFRAEKNSLFWYKDALQYLAEDGVLPDIVVNAMGAVAYKWLSTRGSETLFNDTRAIRSILGLKDDVDIPQNVAQALQEIGVSENYLVETLGSEAYKLLAIQPKPNAPEDFEQRIQRALGMMAVANLEQMGRLNKPKKVFTGKYSTRAAEAKKDTSDAGTFGIDALTSIAVNGEFWATIPSLIKVTDTNKADDGKTVTKYYQVAQSDQRDEGKYLVASKAITDQADLWKLSKDTWDRMFTGEADENEFSWRPFKIKDDRRDKIERTNQFATVEQTKNRLNNSNKPMTVSVNTMKMFLAFSQEMQLEILGYVDPDTKHISEQANVRDTNKGHERDIAAMHDYLAAAEAQEGWKSLFYIPARISKNLRMTQRGTVNPQGSKLHRYVFGMKKWESTFTLGDKDMERRFMEAIAQSLDIEAGKHGGIGAAIVDLNKKLKEPEIKDAVRAVREVLSLLGSDEQSDLFGKLGELHPELAKDILAGVKKGKAKARSLKGLIEYARYLEAQEQAKVTGLPVEFTTDIPTEIDGMSNGPIIALMQLSTQITDKLLSTLRNGGLSFSSKAPDVGVHLSPKNKQSMDTYQAAGMTWNEALIRIEQALRADTGANKQLDELLAAKELFGDFNDEDGYVTGTLRSLIKNPVMTTIYGSGKKALIKGLTNTLITKGIYEKLEKYAQDDDQDKLRDLIKNVNTLAGLPPGTDRKHLFFASRDILGSDGKLIPAKVLALTIPKKSLEAIHEHILVGHGEALSQGIDAIYGDVKEARAPLNKGFSVATALYNVARAHAVDSLKKELIAKGELPIVMIEDGVTQYADLSIAQMKEIDARIKDIFPTMATPFEGGIMDMTGDDNARTYSDAQRVEQKYGPSKGKDNIQGKSNYLAENRTLKSPGVSPIVLSVQAEDATISNRTQGEDLDILNCHDGFFCGIGQVGAVNEALNRNLHRTLSEFDLAQEMHKAVTASVKAFKVYKDAAGADLMPAIQKEFERMEIAEYVEYTDKRGDQKTRKVTGALEVTGIVLTKMGEVAEIATATKHELLQNIKQFNHYYYPNAGFKTGNTKSTIAGLPGLDERIAATVDERATAITEALHSFVEDTTEEPVAVALGSSRDSVFSTKPEDYANPVEINKMTVGDIYDVLKRDSMVQDSHGHDQHLKRLIYDTITGVFNRATMYLTKNPDVETTGLFTQDNQGRDSIFISQQVQGMTPASGALSQGIRMSTGEVYVHELLHAITHHGLAMNPFLRRQVDVLYRLAKKELDKDGQGYRLFLLDPMLDVEDPLNKFEVEAAKARWDYLFVNPPTRTVNTMDGATDRMVTAEYSDHLEEFVSLGLSNERLYAALGNINTDAKSPKFAGDSWWGIVRGNLQDTLLRLYNRVMFFVLDSYRSNPPAGNIAQELERLTRNLGKIDSANKGKVMQLATKADALNQKVAQYVNGGIRKVFEKYPKLNLVRSGGALLASMEDKDNVTGQLLRDVRSHVDSLNFGIVQNIVREVKGLTPRLEAIHKLLNLRKNIIDRAREDTIQNYMGLLRGMWKRELGESEKKSLLKAGIKTDLDTLRDHFKIEDIISMVRSEADLDKAIAEIKRQILADPDIAAYSHYYERQAQSLGMYMAHGRTLEKVTFLNAHLIGGLVNTRHAHKLSPEAKDKAISLVDQLASMYALRLTPDSHRRELADLMDEDTAAVETTLDIHRKLKQDSLTQLFNDNPYKINKGYTKEIINPRTMMAVAPLAAEAKLREEGYTRSIEEIRRDPSDAETTPMYIYTAKHGAVNNLQAGGISYTSNRAKGTNSRTMQEQIGALTGVAVVAKGNANNRKIIQDKAAAIDEMFKNPMKDYDRNADYPNYMVPKVNDQGIISEYRYMMAESTKDGILEKHNAYDAVLASMAGQTIDKLGTLEVNAKWVTALKDMYDAEYATRSSAYVEIGPHSSEKRYRDIYNMLPAATRAQIKKEWGGTRMFVAKDVVDLAFGQYKYSVVEMFGKTEEDRNAMEKMFVFFAQQLFKNNTIQTVADIGDLFVQLTKMAKNNIIVRSLFLTLGNGVSNLHFCRGKGVPAKDMLPWAREATMGAMRYQRDKKILDAAEVKLDMMKNRPTRAGNASAASIKELEDQIREMKNELARNPVTMAIGAGMLPSIVDDVETGDIMSPYPGKIDKLMNKITKKLPRQVNDIGKVALLAEDTQAYKILNNSVKMTDFVARYILYKYYTDPTRGKDRLGYAEAEKWALHKSGPLRERDIAAAVHERAVAQVMHDFVNFNLPTHPMIEWANEVGVFWFTKYALRILKPVATMIQEKPYEALTALALADLMGASHVGESLIGITRDPISIVGNAVTGFLGSGDEIVTMHAAETLLGIHPAVYTGN